MSQLFSVNVTVLATPDIPVIDAPVQTTDNTARITDAVVVNAKYVYAVKAHDPQAEVLSYALLSATTAALPEGLAIGSTGVVTWTPTTAQLGVTAFAVQVTNSSGHSVASGVIQLTVTTTASNGVHHSPQITSSPSAEALVNSQYAYNAQGADQDGDSLAWSLDTSPTGMSINPKTGTIVWTPAAGQAGAQRVVLRLTSSAGLAVTQAYSINVSTSVAPPQIVSNPVTVDAVNSLYQYQFAATTTLPESVTYATTAAPNWLSLNPTTGVLSGTPTDIGTYSVTLTATDALGQSSAQSFNLVVRMVSDLAPQPPVITSQPKTDGTDGAAFTDTVVATDPQGQAITEPTPGSQIETPGTLHRGGLAQLAMKLSPESMASENLPPAHSEGPSPWSNATSASTSLLTPCPSADQDDPFHSAILLAVIPPAVVNVPPAYSAGPLPSSNDVKARTMGKSVPT